MALKKQNQDRRSRCFHRSLSAGDGGTKGGDDSDGGGGGGEEGEEERDSSGVVSQSTQTLR